MSFCSDDTDILLVLPPDSFHVKNSLSNLYKCEDFENLPNTTTSTSSFFYHNNNSIMSGNYNYLTPRHQIALENIDVQLSQIEKDFHSNNKYDDDDDYNFDDKKKKTQLSRTNQIHCNSTPKCEIPLSSLKNKVNEDCTKDYAPSTSFSSGIIQEIDIFLQKNEHGKIDENNFVCESDNNGDSKASRKFKEKGNNLISLSELWNGNNYRYSNENISVQEERLRRQHCEKIIQALQNKLLEYQQKISVAMQVDKMKDSALDKLKDDNRKLNQLTANLDKKLLNFEKQKNEITEKLRIENEEFKIQREKLDKELLQAINLVSKLQDKNEILEIKVENLTRASTDVSSIYKKQIEELELKLLDGQKHEDGVVEELNKFKIQLENVQQNNEKITTENVELKIKLERIKNENENMYKKLNDDENRLKELKKQNKYLEESFEEISKKEKCILKELENQRITLKSHYQQQLENVVAQKLIEFQTQLDSVQGKLKTDAKEREHLIAERSMQQIEMINEKNEQEIRLLTEKHQEEIELYRIQLLNSTRKIKELEEKIDDYKSRRANVAEKLHAVMETQWKQALEILTSPNYSITNGINSGDDLTTINPQKINNHDKLDDIYKNKINKNCNQPQQQSHSENDKNFQTPISKNRKNIIDQRNIHRLQSYIEMLLNKSPNDFNNLQDILSMPKSINNNMLDNQGQSGKIDSNKHKTDGNSKPPWK